MNEILTPILARLTRGNELSPDEIDASELEAGPHEGRGFTVRASLPLEVRP